MQKNSRNNAIGVFDSGIGGLTVVRQLMRQLPNEKIVYFGDTARVPYGTKSRESILRFSKENTMLLLKHKVKMIVVACNTSSGIALSALKNKFTLPIIGVIIPGARKAAALTKSKTIGVIATMATINNRAYVKNIKKFNHSAQVISTACPLFVPIVEEGWVNNKVTLDIARHYLKNIKKSKADTVILGCTHYPLLKSVIKKVLGSSIFLIDSAQEVAKEAKALLKRTKLERTRTDKPEHVFLVSDEPEHFCNMAKKFAGIKIKNIKRIKNV